MKEIKDRSYESCRYEARYLLDSCVVSEFSKSEPAHTVVAWLNHADREQPYLSAVTIGELQASIRALPLSNKRSNLKTWRSAKLVTRFNEPILPVDSDVCLTGGRLVADQRRQGRPMPIMASVTR